MEENDKKWGAKFLINFFYDAKRKEGMEVKEKAKMDFAVEIDKMSTFYMAYSLDVKTGAHNPQKKQRKIFKRELRKNFQYDEKISAYFSTHKAEEDFDEIRNIKEFNPRAVADRLLAFQLADGLLEENRIREIAVLELLFLRMKNADGCTRRQSKRLRREFIETLEHKKDDLKRIIETLSPFDVEEHFSQLGTIDGMIEYFKYQKNNGYPLIEYLKEIWVNSAISILDVIIRKIRLTLQSGDEYSSRSNKYFPTIFGGDSPSIFDQKLQFYNDPGFKKKITYSKNKLSSLILEIFSDLNIELFGICKNKNCGGKNIRKNSELMSYYPKVFVKYPKREKSFCCNDCAAYYSTYIKRGTWKGEDRKNCPF